MIRPMWKAMRTLLLCLLAVLAIAAGGCGDDGDDETTGSEPAAVTQEQKQGEQADKGSTGSGDKSDGKAESDGEGSRDRPASPDAVDSDGDGVPQGFEVEKGGDDSVQTYGEEAESAEEREVVTAMREFFRILVRKDFAAICERLGGAAGEQMQGFIESKGEGATCAEILPEIYFGDPQEARASLEGDVYQVRIKGNDAFVLFTPAGGASRFFVMRREGGVWKAGSLAPGTPFVPTPPKK